MAYSFFQITTTDSIGNTLSGLNQNYIDIESLLTNIQLSAINYWIPMSKIYESKKESWKSATEQIKDNYPLWVDMSTTFESNSSKWISPIVTWYPCILDDQTTENNNYDLQEDILNWIGINYPVLSDISSKPNYTESQIIIVYSLNYKQDTPTQQNYRLFDGTTCSTSNQNVCAHCSKCYHSGSVSCNNGDFWCSGCSTCSKCDSVTCLFDNNAATKSSKIAASIRIDYSNKYESNRLNALIFKVKNCEWVFESIINTAI